MYESIIGLNVINDEGYRAYRAAMTPILEQMGGTFRYDFTIAETLKNGSEHPINRVFTIAFPDQQTSKAFFADAGYLEIRASHFDASVDGITQLGKGLT